MGYRKGQWVAICDVCGFRFHIDEMRKTWNGLLVDKRCYEGDHPQKFLRVSGDPKPVPIINPSPPEDIFIQPQYRNMIVPYGELSITGYSPEVVPNYQVTNSNCIFLLDCSGNLGSSPKDKSPYLSAPTNNLAEISSTISGPFGGNVAKFFGTGVGTVFYPGYTNSLENSAWTLEYFVYVNLTIDGHYIPLVNIRRGSPSSTYFITAYSGSPRYVVVDTPTFGDQFYGYLESPQKVIAANSWKHLAFVRSAGILEPVRIYYDGNYIGSTYSNFDFPLTGQLVVELGEYAYPSTPSGIFYLSDVRMLVNTEVYTGTGSYTVPSSELTQFP